MEGFFTKQQTTSLGRPDGKIRSCASCGLHRHVKSPCMKPFGNFKKEILVIGEAPAEASDKKGIPWQGDAGRFLQQECKRLGIDLFEDCLSMYAVNCRPMDKNGNNREPLFDEIANCRQRVFRVIAEKKPRVIVAFGNAVITCLLGHRWKKNLGGIIKWSGWTIPDRDLGAWVCPVFHPVFVQKSEGNGGVLAIWRKNLKRAFSMWNKPFPQWQDDAQFVEIIDSPAQLKPFSELVAFDYETTGLKPHATGHKIICASVAYNDKAVQVFMMSQKRGEQERFLQLLRDPDIKKMAHNMKFEEAWSVVKLRQSVQNWYWDSMQASHILDNRQGVNSLKFQVYVNFGVIDYASEISPYLDSKSKDGNAFNRIEELIQSPTGCMKLMQYCGLDSLYEYRLARQQMEIMGI